MASLALGAIGGFFFGPIGFMIGSAIGNLLMPQKGQEGPKLTDLKLQASQYGSMIPICYGITRLAGQVIWQTDLVPHKHKTGGKGGGPQVTTYSYTASFAVKVCKGPMGGVLRIWADSTLIYDLTIAALTDNTKVPVTIYLGTEDAGPDPTMETALGVGNVPAFRDDLVCVFTDMDLSNYGNRLPSLSFEVYGATGPIPWRVSTFTPVNYQAIAGFAGTGPMNGSIENGELILSDFGTPHVDISPAPFPFTVYHYDFQGNLLSTEPVIMCDQPPGSETFISIYPCSNNPRIFWVHCNGVDIYRNRFYVDGVMQAGSVMDPASSPSVFAINNAPAFGNDALYAAGGQGSAYVAKWATSGGAPLAFYGLPGTSGQNWTTVVDDRGDVWCVQDEAVTGDQLFHFDGDLNFIASFAQSALPAHLQTGSQTITVWNGILYFSSGTGQGQAYYLPDTLTDPGLIAAFFANAISLGNGYVLVGDGIISLNSQGTITLGEIVANISGRAGLTSGEWDVSALPDLVPGYLIGNQSDARSDIVQLQSAYFFDGVERAGVMTFVKRGGEVEVVIPDNDLAAQTTGATPPALVTYKRIQDVDLPAVVNVTYFNTGAAYQNGTQQAKRQVGQSQAVSDVQLAIAFDDTKGRQVANVLCFGAWLERDVFTILVPRKYEYLEPTDVITAHGYVMRVVRKSDVASGIIQLECVQTNSGLYFSAPTANPTQGGQQTTPGSTSPTELALLDIPLIDDADNVTNPNGAYAAVAGATGGTWPGAILYKSSDGGASFDQIAVDNVADSIGISSNVLANYSGGNTFDEINDLDIVLHPGAGDLVSSNEIGVLNGANLALIGVEVIQFKNATLTAPLTYTLGGLLRGRRGTEWAIGSHNNAERFVLLPASIQVNNPFSEMEQARDYKAVTNGSVITSATDVPFTNTGVALRCYSPTGIGGALNGSGDLAVTWQRRTRVGGAWANFVDVPLSEPTESYIVQIWDSTFSNVARIIGPVSSPAATYTSAQQVTDFGAQQQTIYLTVGQLGELGLGVQTGAALLGAGSTVDAVIAPIPPYNSGPPSPPPSGGCVGTVYTGTLTWAVGGSGYITNPVGFVVGTNWVLSLTTPGSGNFIGQLSFLEYGGAPGAKSGRIALSQCGVPISPSAEQDNQLDPLLRFVLGGTNPNPVLYATLQHATTYYFSLKKLLDTGDSAIYLVINNA